MEHPQPTVLVSGFWRSGTTWLQRILADRLRARTAFEPFSVGNPTYSALLRAYFDVRTKAEREALFPNMDGNTAPFELEDYARAAFAGQHADRFLAFNARPGEEELTRVVVKETRTAFSLRWINKTFPETRIVHVRRDPRAILASMNRYDGHIARDGRGLLRRPRKSDRWWRAGDLSLARILADQYDGRARQIPDEVARLEALDSHCDATKLGVLWAISEKAVAASLAQIDGARLVIYDDAVADPSRLLAAVARDVGIRTQTAVNVSMPSATTDPARIGADATQRRFSWMLELDPEAQHAVRAGVELIDPQLLAPWTSDARATG